MERATRTTGEKFERLVEIMATLRGPNGCPWDKQQDFNSLKPMLVEEVYEVLEGELEVMIDGVAQIVRAGLVAIVPSGVRHSVRALTDGRAIIVDYPLRHDLD